MSTQFQKRVNQIIQSNKDKNELQKDLELFILVKDKMYTTPLVQLLETVKTNIASKEVKNILFNVLIKQNLISTIPRIEITQLLRYYPEMLSSLKDEIKVARKLLSTLSQDEKEKLKTMTHQQATRLFNQRLQNLSEQEFTKLRNQFRDPIKIASYMENKQVIDKLNTQLNYYKQRDGQLLENLETKIKTKLENAQKKIQLPTQPYRSSIIPQTNVRSVVVQSIPSITKSSKVKEQVKPVKKWGVVKTTGYIR